ncbi:MAG TPA: leucine-rich repeat domain-containing protein [Candidatus Limnocylindria bacterium]|nr:leucine-rich repeat domain-containing protein [Candidatus Limnocylindria bacterium]
MRKTLALFLILTSFALPALAQGGAIPAGGRIDGTVASFPGVQNVDVAALRAFLDANPSLTEVELYEANLGHDEMLALADAYPDVFFGFTIRLAEHTLRTDQTAFSTLHSKHSKQHTSQDFRVLRLMKRLKALDIGHNAVTDISFLYDLPDIRILIIAINNITDITPVGSLKDLEFLEMFNNQVTDISPLVNNTKLLDLNIGFNRIEDLTPLASLPQLERLWMYSYRRRSQEPTREVREQVRQMLPNTQVNFVNYPTLAGWREHQRYYVLHAVFKNSTWLPWDADVPVVKQP